VAALDAIVITGSTLVFNSANSRYTTTTDVVLPASSLGLPIVWTSTNPTFLSIAGVVVRPAYGQSDSTVILTATIGEDTSDFIITVLAETVKPVALVLQEAKDALLLAGVGNGIAANIVLPMTAGSEGVTVSWASNNPAILSNLGVVNRQSENTTVILTATLTYQSQTVTKEFEVVVLSFAPYVVVANIAAALAEGKGAYVRVPDVTIVGRTTDGFMIYDGTTLLFVFLNAEPAADVTVGSVFTITGLVDIYFGSPQFNSTKSAETPVVLTPSSAAPSVLTPRVITTSVSEYIATLPTEYSDTSTLVYEYITIKAKVRVQDNTNYGTFLVNSNYNDANNIVLATGTTLNPNALMFYYKSNMAAVQPFNGLEVTLNVFLYALRTNQSIYAVIFTGTADDVHTTLDDAGIVNVAKTSLASKFSGMYTEAATLQLPATLLGTSIVWSTTTPEYVNTTTGALTMPTEQANANLTATITRGTVTDTLTVNFKVGPLPQTSIQEVIDSPLNALIRTKGVVTASEYYRTFFIQDATGGIAIYTANAAFLTFLNANLGKEVEVFGSRAVFSGMRQISPTAINLIGDGVMPAAQNVDAVQIHASTMLAYQGEIITMTQMIVKSRTIDSFNNVTIVFERISESGAITMKWDSRKALGTAAAALLETVTVGKVFDITNVLAWNNNPYLYFTDSTIMTEVQISDANKVHLDAKALTLPTLIQNANPLTLPATGTNGSTIVWVSDTTATITNAGVVTLPEAGNVTVKMTATLTLNAASKVVEFTIVVGLSDAAKVDMDGAAISIPASITEAGTLTLPVTGAKGSAIVWASNDALINVTTGAVTMPVSGTVTVVLTATLTLNAIVKDFTFNVEVGIPDVIYSTDLFISYYMEGDGGNKKILVIFNNTGSTVDLSNYKIGAATNPTAAPTASSFVGPTLSGNLEHGKALIIYHGEMVNTSLPASYFEAFASAISPANLPAGNITLVYSWTFNGERSDIIGLVKNVSGTWTIIDQIGLFESALSSGSTAWETSYMKNKTLIRKDTILGPVNVVDWNQWIVLDVNTFDARINTWK
jgi:hypothetical protein